MLRRLIFVCTVALAAHAHAAEAGKVIFAAGTTHIAQRTGAEGAVVNEGDLLETGADGYLYVKTTDNGLFILRPSSKARIVTYHVDSQQPSRTQVKLELISGVARSKSGDAVKLARQNFRFNTPVAAIGVRGTDFTVYTDGDTSRVSVLTGRVVVSGFGGACTPEGGGPCEGAATRELSAAQRGQLLVRRGQLAPQLMSTTSGAPDLVSPPRADEPVAKTGGGADQMLDAKKSDSIDKKLAEQVPPPQVQTPPPVVNVITPPAREIQWGRWAEVAGVAPTIGIAGPPGSDRLLMGEYAVFLTAGRDYVAPERGSVAFALKGGEASITNIDPTQSSLRAQMQNGALNVDFGKSTFTTSFDLVAGNDKFNMQATGALGAGGRFSTPYFDLSNPSNMTVDGVLSESNGGSAAYLFRRHLEDNRTITGVTYWAH